MSEQRKKPQHKKPRDPSWRLRRSLGHRVVRDRTKYNRKKHKQDVVTKVDM